MPASRALAALVLLLTLAGCGTPVEPTGRYRELSDPFPLGRTPCDPFPPGVTPTFRYLTRIDDFVKEPGGELRRMVELHYAVGDQRTVLDKVVTAFERAGFHLVLLDEGKKQARLSRADYGTVGVTLRQLTDLPEDAALKGIVALDLPPESRRRVDERRLGCRPPRNRDLYREYLR